MIFDEEMRHRGWAVFERHIPMTTVEWMRTELSEAYALCRQIQVRNGIGDATEHTVHHLVGQGRSWLCCLSQMPNDFIHDFFGGPFILNSFGGQFNMADGTNYAAAIHRDIRPYLQDRVMLNAIVTLDDTTTENGATWLMAGGHRFPEKPDEEVFKARAEQVCAPAGSVILFDSRVWHRAGVNRSSGPRRIVTPMYSKPFFKPQMDYPRVLGEDAWLSEELRQIVGYNARIPSTLDEWYRVPEKRMYRPDQG